MGQESWNRNAAGLVRLGSAKHNTAADIGECPTHVDPATRQVDVTHAQGRGFAPAQARVAEQQNKHPPGTGFSGQGVELLVGEEHIVTALDSGQAQPMCGVDADTASAHGMIKCGGHDEHRLARSPTGQGHRGTAGQPTA